MSRLLLAGGDLLLVVAAFVVAAHFLAASGGFDAGWVTSVCSPSSEVRQNRELGLVPVGFVDDDPAQQGREVHGLPGEGLVFSMTIWKWFRVPLHADGKRDVQLSR